MHAESKAPAQQSTQGTELSTWLSQSTNELPDVTPAGKVHLEKLLGGGCIHFILVSSHPESSLPEA